MVCRRLLLLVSPSASRAALIVLAALWAMILLLVSLGTAAGQTRAASPADVLIVRPGGIVAAAGSGANGAGGDTTRGTKLIAAGAAWQSGDVVQLNAGTFDCGGTIPSTTALYVGMGTGRTSITINQTTANLAAFAGRVQRATIVGSDGTIQRGVEWLSVTGRPFAPVMLRHDGDVAGYSTIEAALAASVAGDVVQVWDNSVVSSPTVLTADVNIELAPGVELNTYFQAGSGVQSVITGGGSLGTNATYALSTTDATAEIHFTGKRLTTTGNGSPTIKTEGGKIWVRASDRIETTGNYDAIWADGGGEIVVDTPLATAGQNVVEVSNNSTVKGYIGLARCKLISQASSEVAVLNLGQGTVALDVPVIENRSDAGAYGDYSLDAGNVTGWLRGVSWQGTAIVQGATGALTLEGMTIDATHTSDTSGEWTNAPALWLLSDNLTLKDVRLISHSGATYSILADAPRTATVVGTLALDLPAHPDVTFTGPGQVFVNGLRVYPTVLTVAEGGTGANAAGPARSNLKIPALIFSHFADAANSGTTETDLYSDSIPASGAYGNLAANGDTIVAHYAVTLATAGTEAITIRLYFGGTEIFLDTGTASTFASLSPQYDVSITRVSASVARYAVIPHGTSDDANVALGELTGLTLANAQILKVTGRASGTGGGSGDIVAKKADVTYWPIAQ